MAAILTMTKEINFRQILTKKKILLRKTEPAYIPNF